MTLGRNIRAARDSRGLSQHDLAVKLECHAMLVSKWERGLHAPSEGNLHAIASALGHPVAWFYTDHQPKAAA